TVKALILLNVDGKHILDVESDVSRHQNVEAVYDITGEFDVAVIASFKSISELDEFVKWLLKHPYIKQSRTSIIFRVAKEEKRLPL
ncbi:MAG: Lrp/AsnC family transcriptional regulator, partial [Thermogladius sp.]